MRDLRDVEEAFEHSPPRTPDEIQQHVEVRNECKVLAVQLYVMLPECPERTLAIRHVEQAMFYANAALARNRVSP